MNIKRKILAALFSISMLFASACQSPSSPTADLTSSVSTEFHDETASRTLSPDDTEQTTAAAESESVQSSESSTSAEQTETETTAPAAVTTAPKNEKPVAENFSDDMVVHFIDVGQADSIFIELPNDECMLIDAGEKDQADKITAYIYNQGYDTIDYVVATHPHSDHIGGMADVVNSFTIKNFYMTAAVHTSQTYANMLIAVENSGADIHNTGAATVILDKANLTIEAVAPQMTDGYDLNNTSIVLKLTYGDKRFLFAGDAEKDEEDNIRTNIKCDVLKVGHHGSNSSTSENFLKKTEPSYAVISAGLKNSYGHPDDVILKRLADRDIDVYRTDMQGTIIFTTDGKEISVNTEPSRYEKPVVTAPPETKPQETKPPITNSSPTGITYVLNTSTKKIHYTDCSSVKLMKESNKSYTKDYRGAVAQGYTPCKRCSP